MTRVFDRARVRILAPDHSRRKIMNLASTLLLALAMSTDAFAAAISKGAALHRPRLREALRTGLIFGAVEAITPLVGWGLGKIAAPYVMAWDSWIAFAMLTILGLRMIRASLTAPIPAPESVHEAGTDAVGDRPARHGFWVLAATGLATSLDALAVGAGLAFVDVDIMPTALTIGLSTMILAMIGFMVGKAMGVMIGRRAEMLGGIILIGIGATIAAEHVGWIR